jgi:predicted alpha/beta-hydrolase family hydrolase
MERKVGSSTTVTSKEIKAALEKAHTLTSEEEKVLRLRHGAGATSKSAPLPRAAGNNEELGDELLLIEMQLMKAMRERTGQTRSASNKPKATTTPAASATKEKIVRALRKKK